MVLVDDFELVLEVLLNDFNVLLVLLDLVQLPLFRRRVHLVILLIIRVLEGPAIQLIHLSEGVVLRIRVKILVIGSVSWVLSLTARIQLRCSSLTKHGGWLLGKVHLLIRDQLDGLDCLEVLFIINIIINNQLISYWVQHGLPPLQGCRRLFIKILSWDIKVQLLFAYVTLRGKGLLQLLRLL